MKQVLAVVLVGFVRAADPLPFVTPPPVGVTATPLSKVLDMLDTMLGTCKEEKNAEETEFAKFSQWCSSTRTGYDRSIAEATSKIEQLTADITKAKADAAEHAATADEHTAKADAAEKELASATAVREAQNAEFTATDSDYAGAINAIERAKATLMARA